MWRSFELWVFNFSKNYLTTSTICGSERTEFVVFLEKSKVWISLRFTCYLSDLLFRTVYNTMWFVVAVSTVTKDVYLWPDRYLSFRKDSSSSNSGYPLDSNPDFPKAYLGRSPMDKKELNSALLEGARKHGDQITNFDWTIYICTYLYPKFSQIL